MKSSHTHTRAAGAYASDQFGTALNVTVLGYPTGNFTANVTLRPIVVVYSATDAANHTATATRQLTVIDPCTVSTGSGFRV